MLNIFVLILLCFASIECQKLSYSVDYTSSTMSGIVSGTLLYDWSSKAYLLNFTSLTTGSYMILYQYNSNGGESSTAQPFLNQWRYKIGPGCPSGCETGTLQQSIPRLFLDTTYYTPTSNNSNIKGKICKRYIPSTTYTTSPVNEIWFATDFSLCKALFKEDGAIVTVTGTVNQNFSTSVFSPPSGCSCGKALDIVLVLDRSSSIVYRSWWQMYSFLNGFVSNFQFAYNKANLAIAHFSSKTWTSLDFAQSVTSDAVINAAKGLACCNPWTGNNLTSCCDGWTSISSGIRAGADLMARSNRPSTVATKVMILITDGNHNTLYNKSFPDKPIDNSCYNKCNAYKYQTDEWYYCVGDKNADGIPDTWLAPTPQSPPRTCATCGSIYSRKAIDECHMDLIEAREYAKSKIPDMVFYAVGVTDFSAGELEIVTDNRYKKPATATTSWVPTYLASDKDHPERILTTTSFQLLGNILIELTSKICDENSAPCGDCCGFCFCSVCVPPTTCPAPACYEGYLEYGCCKTRPISCETTDLCFPRSCSATNGTCITTPVVCPPDNECYSYSCRAGQCISSPRWTQPADRCSTLSCDNSTGVPKLVTTTVNCENQPRPNSCKEYSCEPTTGQCIASKDRPIPAPIDACNTYECDPKADRSNPFFVKTKVCASTDKCNPSSCDPISGNCVNTPVVCKDSNNVCDLTTCDSSTGLCTEKRSLQCAPFKNGDKCQPLVTCDPTLGCVYDVVTCNQTDCHPVSCDSSTGLCVKDTKPCAEICNTPCPVNKCWKQKCDELGNAANCDAPPDDLSVRCTDAKSNTCIIYVGCDNNTGCVYDPVQCPEKDNKCLIVSKNSSEPGCCVYTPKNCDQGDKCLLYSCDEATGSCLSTPKCKESSICITRGCKDGECWEEPIVCTPTPCQISLGCNETVGCVFKDKDCDDKNPCTVDSCGADGECVNTPLDCDDGLACTTDTCELGKCVSTPIVCNDDNMCTSDSCDSQTGKCVFVDHSSDCEDNDLCTQNLCLPNEGCVFVKIDTCPTFSSCDIPVCDKYFGCLTKKIECVINTTGGADVYEGDGNFTANGSATDCSFAYCSEGLCLIQTLECGNPDSVVDIIANGAITGGIIAGIVLAALIAVCLTGGGVAAIVKNVGTDGVASVNQNPLFVGAGSATTNPLYEVPN